MEELIDIDNYDDKLKDIKEKVSKNKKKEKKEEYLSKEDKKLKSKNKYQKYIILLLSCVTLFLSYHFLLQYTNNLENQIAIKQKLLLSYQQNINGSLKEIESIEYENDILKSEIKQYKAKYDDYYKQYELFKKENDKIIEYSDIIAEKGRKLRGKYNIYKKEFENISNTFHSFFESQNEK